MPKRIFVEKIYKDEDGKTLGSSSFGEYDEVCGEDEPNEFLCDFTGRWGKVYMGRSFNLSSATFGGYMLTLMSYVRTGNAIKNIKGRKIDNATDEDIMNILGIAPQTFRKFIAECRKKGYIYATKDESGRKTYFVNPAYYFVGRKVNLTLFAIFKHNRDFVYSLTRDTKAEIYNRYCEDLFHGGKGYDNDGSLDVEIDTEPDSLRDEN